MAATEVKYTDTALPTDSDTFVLFNSENLLPVGAANMINNCGWQRYTATIWHSQNGTVNGYFRDTGSATWRKFFAAAKTAGTEASTVDVLIGGMGEVKFEWVNGGVTQTAFDIKQALDTDRGAAS